ncbi:MAG: hypothetical protein AAF705_02815, partial [Bacteroidota bacterium]
MTMMKRSDGRVKAKYFAAKDYSDRSVYERFQNWKKSNPNVILVSSGTYTDDYDKPQGLAIDNGVVVNRTLIKDRMHALTIVYASGGIAVSDIREGNLTISGGSYASSEPLDITDPKDLARFIKWAQDQEATVFQTHLLVYRDQLEISSTNSSKTKRERRFLAVGKDEDGDIVHVVVQHPKYASLYSASKNTHQFLTDFQDLEIIFMINLDTGNQDVFELYNSNCTKNTSVKGRQPLSKAVNLLVYHFQ